MATKKIFRLDLLVEWFRSSVEACDSCPVESECFALGDTEILCDGERAEEFKQEIIDKFSTDVEVVDSEAN